MGHRQGTSSSVGGRGAAALLAIAAAAVGLGGCGTDIASIYPVEVTVLGNPSAVTITLEWDGGIDAVELVPDSTARFATRLAGGSSITLRAPADCRFGNGDSSLALTTKDQPSRVSLGCPDVLELTSLGLSLPIAPVRNNLTFEITMGALLAAASPVVTVTPAPKYPEATLELNGVPASEATLAAAPLTLGSNRLDVSYAAFGMRRSYTVVLRRAATAHELVRVPGATASGALGTVLAASGELLAVGEPGVGDGRVLVYRLTAAGWTPEGTLTGAPPDSTGQTGSFGAAVAISGDTIAVGAPLDAAMDSGAVYVFGRQGGVWSQLRRLTPLVPGSRFGAALAISASNQLAVGAPDENAAQGAAYLYGNLGDIVGMPTRFVASNADNDDHFGHALTFAGTRLLISAPDEDGGTTSAGADNSASNAGAVYGFTLATGAQSSYLKGARTAGERLGAYLASSSAGDAVVLARNVGGVTALDCYSTALAFRYVTSTTGSINALAMEGDRVAVGQTIGGNLRVNVYRLESSSVREIATPFTGSGALGGDGFGRALALRGDRLYVGAGRQGAQTQGAFYVFE